MSTLYQLTGERLALQNRLEQSGFDSETIADTLEAESGDLENKFIDYCYVLKNIEAEIQPYTTEIERLTSIVKSKNNTIEAIKTRMLDAFVASKLDIVKGDIFTVKSQLNPASVVIDDESLIPPDYFKQPVLPPPTLDKALVKQAIADGYVVAGAHLEQKVRLVIK